MKKLLLILPLLALSFPVHAADEATSAPAASVALSADEQVRLDLAGKMHEIWPIRTRVESALESISKNFPEEKQTEAKAALRKAINFDLLEEESIKAMAQTFTAEELKAMIEFYGSDNGKAISAKTQDYEEALRPVMTKMIDGAMLDLRTGQQP